MNDYSYIYMYKRIVFKNQFIYKLQNKNYKMNEFIEILNKK